MSFKRKVAIFAEKMDHIKYRYNYIKEWEIIGDNFISKYINKVKKTKRFVIDLFKQGSKLENIIILFNSKTASAAESAIFQSKNLNPVLIGVNSSGCNTFGEPFIYYLPNSLIKLRLARKISIMSDFREGVGFKPNYWLDTSKPVIEIINWLKNPIDYQFKIE